MAMNPLNNSIPLPDKLNRLNFFNIHLIIHTKGIRPDLQLPPLSDRELKDNVNVSDSQYSVENGWFGLPTDECRRNSNSIQFDPILLQNQPKLTSDIQPKLLFR
jgi:hypothetical protein